MVRVREEAVAVVSAAVEAVAEKEEVVVAVVTAAVEVAVAKEEVLADKAEAEDVKVVTLAAEIQAEALEISLAVVAMTKVETLAGAENAKAVVAKEEDVLKQGD